MLSWNWSRKRLALQNSDQLNIFGHSTLINLCGAPHKWTKQIFHNKGSTVDQHGARQRTAAFEDFFEFDGTKLKQFPVSAETPAALAQALDRLAQELKSHAPASALASSAGHTRAALDAAKQRWTETLQRMIALQEELDWECYRLYGLVGAGERRAESGERKTEDGGRSSELGGLKSEYEGDWEGGGVPPLKLGERAFEIVMARSRLPQGCSALSQICRTTGSIPS